MTDISLTAVLSAAGSGIVVPFVNKVLGPASDELGLVLGERIRMFRLQNQIKLFRDAQKMLTNAGVEPKQVSLKTLLPLMEGASMEEEPVLAQRWAALLANAANTEARASVEPSFAEVLKQLTAIQVAILDEMYFAAIRSHLQPAEQTFSHFFTSGFTQSLNMNISEFSIQIDNLLRLRLCASKDHLYTYSSSEEINAGITKSLTQTMYGCAFVIACTPPAKGSGK